MTPAYRYFLTLLMARTLIVALFLIGGLRLVGKRSFGQYNIYDLAMIMAVANAVQNAMTHGAGDLSAGIVCSGTLILLGWAFSKLFLHVPKLEAHIVGVPTPLILNGELLPQNMRREKVTEAELLAAIRQHGLERFEEVHLAQLEVDGSISVVPVKGIEVD